MFPFVQQQIGARKLLIYSESYGEHPMNAAELTNSTGKTLDGGPSPFSTRPVTPVRRWSTP